MVWFVSFGLTLIAATAMGQEAIQIAPRSIKTEITEFELPREYRIELEAVEWSKRPTGEGELYLAVLKDGSLIEKLKAQRKEGVKLLSSPMVRTIEGFPSLVCSIAGDQSNQHRVTPTIRTTGDLLFEVDSSIYLGKENSESYKRLGGVKYPFVVKDGGFALALYRYRDKTGGEHRLLTVYHPTVDPRP